MKIKLLFLSFSLCSIFAIAQRNSSELTFDPIYVNTNINYISLGFNPIDMQIGSKAFTMGTTLKATALYSNIYLKMESNSSYLIADEIGNAVLGSPTNGTGKTKNFELVGGYYFTHEVSGPVHIRLGGNGNTTYLAKIDSKYEKFYGVEVGFSTGSRVVYANGQYNAIDLGTNQPTSFNGEFNTNMNYTYLYIGGSFGKLINVKANFSTYGEKAGFDLHKVYGHLIIPLKTSLDDITYTQTDPTTGNTVNKNYHIDNTITRTNLGFRIGYDQDFANRVMSGGGEFSVFPGIQGNGNYLIRLKVNIGLNAILGRK